MQFMPIYYGKNVVGLFKFIAEGRGYHPQTEILELFGFDEGQDKKLYEQVIDLL